MSSLPIAIQPFADPNPNPVQALAAPYLAYHLTTAYDSDTGIEILPVAGPEGTPPEIIKLHASVAVKRVLFLVIRLDCKPQLPDPNTQDSQEVLMSKRIVGSAPGRLPDGTSYMAVFGEYTFALTVTPGPNDTLYFGVAPYDVSGSYVSQYTPADFIQGIISGSPTLQGPQPGSSGISTGIAQG